MLKYGFYGGLAGSLWLGGCGKRRYGKTRPNVLLIVLDTSRADRFSFLGYHRNTSPHIDALASEATVYERAYATNFWTLPSHASLFTGLYSSQAGATSETNHLPTFNTTLAELLKQVGYDTAAVSCNVWVCKDRGFGKGFNEFYEMWRAEHHPQVPNQPGVPEWAAMKKIPPWLEQRNAIQNPFFLFVNLNCAHMPYQPPQPFLSRFVEPGYNKIEVDSIASIKETWGHLTGELKLTERDFRIMNDLYDGEIAFADHCVGQIIDRLRALGILDDTVVIVTSDHGENLGDHGLTDHLFSMYETTLHVPLVIRYPKRFQIGVRINDLVSLVDVAPTILDLCGIHNGVKTMKPTISSLARKDRPRRTFIVAENERPLNAIAILKSYFPAFDTGAIDHRMRAIRTKQHKFIWNIDDGKELYDLQIDPEELNNLADEQTEICRNLHQTLNLWMNRIPSAGDVSLLESQDAESLEILRSLGYIK